MAILKNYFIFKNKLIIILILVSNLFSLTNLAIGDKYFLKKYHEKAILYYLKTDVNTQKRIQPRIIESYLHTGDKYYKIKLYKKALLWYEKAAKLKNHSAIFKIGQVYEKKADIYTKAHKYTKALVYYEKAYKFKNKNLNSKIDSVKNKISHQKNLSGDTRILVSKDSPSWTHSIGRLLIPTKLEFLSKKKYRKEKKKCSATLVNIDKRSDSSIIITASHCVNSFNPKAGQIKFLIRDKNNKMIYRTASIVFNSNFNIKKMKSTTDFAILLLNKKISYKKIKPIIVRKYSLNTLQKAHKNNFGSLGGFSSDIASYGVNLTYDPKCKLSTFSKMYAASTCKGFKGASGGPIMLTTINDNKTFQYHFVGVVSHFRNKDFTNIFFAPHHLFYDKIKKVINSK